MHARYFFIVDKVDKYEVKIMYCPIEKMVIVSLCKEGYSQYTEIQYRVYLKRTLSCTRDGIRRFLRSMTCGIK